MDLDLNRWHALVEARRNAEHDGPTPLQLQQAQTAAAQAQADLDLYRARGATGRGDTRNSPAEINAHFARSITELEARVVERKREADRIAARSKACAERRNALARLVGGVREWAKAQSPPIRLPGDDDAVTGMTGFPSTSLHISTPPGREFAPSQTVAPRQGGITAAAEPPTPRVHRGTSGVVRTMSRVWP
jgi:hypothetical protein